MAYEVPQNVKLGAPGCVTEWTQTGVLGAASLLPANNSTNGYFFMTTNEFLSTLQ